MKRFLAAVFLCFLTAGCATPQTDALLRASNAMPQRGTVAEPVFFAQNTNECGPAALAMMLGHSGLDVTPDGLVDEVFAPSRGGTLSSAVVAAARRHGRIAYPLNSLAALVSEINRGRQVMVLQNLGLSWAPQWHYAVAVGYDLGTRTIVLHSGTTPFLATPLATFERTWSRGDRWALLTLRPDEFPENADESTYVTSVAGVERAGALGVAAQAYRGALTRWPQNPIALMGLGNALYGMGDLRGAAEAFLTASTRLPENADAFNNLGHVLAELGELAAAEKAVLTAVKLGGANSETYQDTLSTIRKRLAAPTSIPTS